MTTVRVWLSVLLLAAASIAGPKEQFAEGLQRYRANDMTGAAEIWQSLVDQGITSGVLYYNLGNAYYREGRIGKAIQCYERARLYLPRDRDVSNNLELARLGTVDKIEVPIRLVIWNWVDGIRDFFSLRELGVLFLIAGFVVCALVAVSRFSPGRTSILARKALVIAITAYALVGAWYAWRSALDSRAFGIILATKTDAYSAPDQGSKQVFSLHEGTKVRLGETIRGTRPGESVTGWTQVRLADGRQGWIPTSDFERI